MAGGAYTLCAHTGLRRPAEDFDVLCKSADARRVLGRFEALGCRVEFEDKHYICGRGP